MKITISKSQWEEMGKKAGWAIDEETVECLVCGKPTKMTGTKLCDRCWMVVNYIKNPVTVSDRGTVYRLTDDEIKKKARDLIGKGII
jgi:hypothetical protein